MSTKINRPPQHPHFGSVIERLFGTTTSEFLNQLRGNTQASREPRQMTREVDPKRLAALDQNRDNGTIRTDDLPGSLQREFPGEFKGKSLDEIRRQCAM